MQDSSGLEMTLQAKKVWKWQL